jgi:hypothetical protein
MKIAKQKGDFLNVVWYQVADLDELKSNLKGATLPMIRSYRNLKTG